MNSDRKRRAGESFSLPRLLAYGLFGFPLALLALPIYVYVPQFYAERFGMSLSLIGSALLVSRVLDAFLILCLAHG
jgi:Na+/melibiose symporter-like transporter